MADSWAMDLAGGSFGAVLCAMVGLPFDTTKTRMQTSPTMYRGMVDAFSRMKATEGVLSLWKGGSPAVLSAVIENSVLFTANGGMKRFWGAARGVTEADLTSFENAVIGGFCGVLSATAICAPEVIKCRLQVSRAGGSVQYTGAMDCVRKTLASDGARGFFRGLAPLLARDVPFNTIMFGCESLYTKLLAWMPPSLLPFFAGGFAGSTAWAIIFPFDVVKSRLQVGAGEDGTRSTLNMARHLYAAGGVRVFYVGVIPAVTRAFFANGALFLGVRTWAAMMAPSTHE